MRPTHKLLNGLILGTAISCAGPAIGGLNMAQAQTTPALTTDSDMEEVPNAALTQITMERTIAEARRDLLKVQNEVKEEERKAKAIDLETKLEGLPTPVTTGLDGTITVDAESGYYGQTLAYASIDQAAYAIKTDLCQKLNGEKIFILNGFKLAETVAQWKFVDAELNRMDRIIDSSTTALNDYSNRKKMFSSDGGTEGVISTTGLALTALPKIAGAVGDIAKLFKTNVSVSTVKLDNMESALRAAVIGSIVSDPNCTVKILDPSMSNSRASVLSTKMGNISEKSADLATLQEQVLLGLETARLKKSAEQKQHSLIADNLEARIMLRDDKTPTETEEAQISDRRQLAANDEAEATTLAYMQTSIKAAVKSTTDRVTKLEAALTVPSETAVPALQSLSIVDQLMNSKSTHFLSLKVDSAGSESQISSNAFRSDRLSYYGSVAVTYEVSNGDGLIKAAGLKTHTCTGTAKRKDGFLDFAGTSGTRC